MSRSVSSATGAFAVAYQDVSWMGYQSEDENGKKIDNPEFDEEQAWFDWDWFVEDTVESIKAQYPSFTECDKWLGREDHAMLQNRFAYFGISEYGSLVSLWMVLKDDLNEYGDKQGIAENWARQVEKSFLESFGDLVKLGSFSNGEGVYRKKGKK